MSPPPSLHFLIQKFVPPPPAPAEGEVRDWAAGRRGRLLEITWFTFADLSDAILEETLEFVDMGGGGEGGGRKEEKEEKKRK